MQWSRGTLKTRRPRPRLRAGPVLVRLVAQIPPQSSTPGRCGSRQFRIVDLFCEFGGFGLGAALAARKN